jgi:hypothetical protein
LRWACSSRASSQFWSWTRWRVSWTFVRVTVRHRRCAGAGPKLRLNSWATTRFPSRSASAQSRVRPRGARWDGAGAWGWGPALGPAPARARARDVQ